MPDDLLRLFVSSLDLICHSIAGETHPNSTQIINGSSVNPYNVDCLKDVTKRSSKPLKRHVIHGSLYLL